MRILVATLVLFLGGCALVESDAGKADYEYTVTTPDGTVHNIRLRNAKNIGLVSATVKYGDVEVELLEQGVDASGPMQIMAESNAALVQAVLSATP